LYTLFRKGSQTAPDRQVVNGAQQSTAPGFYKQTDAVLINAKSQWRASYAKAKNQVSLVVWQAKQPDVDDPAWASIVV
jgi:hypothetical protein